MCVSDSPEQLQLGTKRDNAARLSDGALRKCVRRETSSSSFLCFLAVGKQRNGTFPPPTGEECGPEYLRLTLDLNVET